MFRLRLTLLMLALPLHARWWMVESGPFVVYTDAGEKAGRDTLGKLDLARRVFERLAGKNPLPLPVTAFALASASRFRALRPVETARGYYQSAAQRDYIVLDWQAADHSRVVYHEFVHLTLNHSTGPLPQWLEEGLAEFHSTLEASGSRVRLGFPVRAHLRLLGQARWMPAAELGAVTKESGHYNEASRAGLFYAQSWALVHMLRLDEKYRDGFGLFLTSLAAGESQPEAFQRAFQKSLSEAIADLKPYLDRGMLPTVEHPFDLGTDLTQVRSMEIGELDGEMAYAELASVSGRPEEAEKAYRRVLGGNPTSAREAAAFGMIELARRKPNEAKQYFERSMQLPDTPAEAFFEYAMLVRDSGGSRELVRRNLEMAVSRNPNYAEAHFLLGLSAANEGRHAEAIPHLEQAVSIFPRQSPFWHALAFSLHAAGRSEEARRAAQRALDSAANPQQAEMARAAVRLTGTPRPAAAAKAADVVVPESWRNPKGDSSIDGVLERIDCLGPSARFHIRAGGKPVAVFVQNPGEVLLKNLSSMTFEFRCGPQKPVPVVVEYKRQPDAEKGTVGVVTGIEFR